MSANFGYLVFLQAQYCHFYGSFSSTNWIEKLLFE
jgi:hypothetical protein